MADDTFFKLLKDKIQQDKDKMQQDQDVETESMLEKRMLDHNVLRSPSSEESQRMLEFLERRGVATGKSATSLMPDEDPSQINPSGTLDHRQLVQALKASGLTPTDAFHQGYGNEENLRYKGEFTPQTQEMLEEVPSNLTRDYYPGVEWENRTATPNIREILERLKKK